MLILQIRQAEHAFRQGHLDEAFASAISDAVRNHRRGRDLIVRLAEALVNRGREHLDTGNISQAIADCNKAERLSGNSVSVQVLRSDIAQFNDQRLRANDKQLRAGARRRTILTDARQYIADGRLSLAGFALENGLKGDNSADELLEKASLKRFERSAISAALSGALDNNDLQAAVRAISDSIDLGCRDAILGELGGRFQDMVVSQTRTAIEQGRLDRARAILEMVQPLSIDSVEIAEMAHLMTRFCDIAGAIQSGDIRDVARKLRQIKALLPSADWLEKAIASAAALDELFAGPLGWLGLPAEPEKIEVPVNKEVTNKVGTDKNHHKDKARANMAHKTAIPMRFIIQVDGVGSFLVVRNSPVTIGPISSRPQIPLVTKVTTPVLTVERSEEDYFCKADRPVKINEKLVTERLLANADAIWLSDRCGLKFLLPNAASTTANLQFSSARYPRLDIKTAILLDREIIVGPGPSAHIRIDRLLDKFVLFVKDGELVCCSDREVLVNQIPHDITKALPLERPVQIGEVSFVLTEN